MKDKMLELADKIEELAQLLIEVAAGIREAMDVSGEPF